MDYEQMLDKFLYDAQILPYMCVGRSSNFFSSQHAAPLLEARKSRHSSCLRSRTQAASLHNGPSG
ncbi:hypothetical protein TSMEX_009239 [Taenia solium]|eukprot:TsM_000772300 transcript=TsM_000772300 gene=TsM_000772300